LGTFQELVKPKGGLQHDHYYYLN